MHSSHCTTFTFLDTTELNQCVVFAEPHPLVYLILVMYKLLGEMALSHAHIALRPHINYLPF